MSQPSGKRIDYAGSVHGEEEIAAVVDVLSGSPTALRIGKNARKLEQLVAATFAKRRGVMVNSGSSALYLAIELLRPQPGDEIITSPVTFSTDIAPMARAGVTPVFVDLTPDTYQLDTDRLEEAVTERTTAILVPNLIGNCPDWDVIREVADRHDLVVIEDSCDCMGATLRGAPVEEGERRFFSQLPDGQTYDDLFIFDELGWNFEPSELSAAFGVVQMGRLDGFLERRKRNEALLTEFFAAHDEHFVVPRLTTGIDTAWHMYPIQIRPTSPIDRGEFQLHMERAGVDTRMVWTGNATRQPAFADITFRQPADGLPNADRVMETGLVLPCNHGIDDDGVAYICETITAYLDGLTGRSDLEGA